MYLNGDVATQILLHLPVQSVLRFRSVCKSWSNIIDSSTFAESHLQNQSGKNGGETLLLQFNEWRSPWEMSMLNADNGKLHKGFTAFQKFSNDIIRSCNVVGPVNGLICMYKTQLYYGNPESYHIAMYNPCLDKIKILPLSPICLSIGYKWGSAYCYRNIGFGFDSAAKDYKVVQLMSFSGVRTYVEIYSRKTNSWRKLITDSTLDNELILHYIQEIKSSAYLGSGSMAHWSAPRRTAHPEDVILLFNIQSEVFEMIPYPDFEWQFIDGKYKVVFANGDYSFVLFAYTLGYMKVWELESRDNKRFWTQVRVVKFVRPAIALPEPRALCKGSVVVFIEHGFKNGVFTIYLYDYSKQEVQIRFETTVYTDELLHYKGSCISP